MRITIKVKGITGRWLLNIMAVFVALVLLCIVAFSFLIQGFYYDTISQYITDRSFNVSGNLRPYTGGTASEFSNAAIEFVSTYQDRDKMEIQILDADGDIIISTLGYQPERQVMADYDSAVDSTTLTGSWVGRNASNEKVMAVTNVLKSQDNTRMGAVRFIVSLENTDRQVSMSIMVVAAVGILLLLFVYLSGLYFIKSIVNPVKEVSETARKIAMGDFNARIQVRNTNEIGQLCDTINYMADELKSADNLKNDFISSVSHELRTPLTAIKGWGETIKSAVGTDDKIIQKGTDIILSEAERLSTMVEDLLDFSRMQSGRLSVKMERCDLLAELDEAVYMYEESARKAGIEFSIIEPKVAVPVIGDANRLKQVFINIIDNAIKYTGVGGKALIEVTVAEQVKIRIIDTGSGIASEHLDKVKDKFYKADQTVKGSGIGLAVADEIIKQHKGALYIDSTKGEGTCVTITLPLAPDIEEELIERAVRNQKELELHEQLTLNLDAEEENKRVEDHPPDQS